MSNPVIRINTKDNTLSLEGIPLELFQQSNGRITNMEAVEVGERRRGSAWTRGKFSFKITSTDEKWSKNEDGTFEAALNAAILTDSYGTRMRVALKEAAPIKGFNPNIEDNKNTSENNSEDTF